MQLQEYSYENNYMETDCYLGANMSKPVAYVVYGNFYIHISWYLRFSGQMLLDWSCV